MPHQDPRASRQCYPHCNIWEDYLDLELWPSRIDWKGRRPSQAGRTERGQGSQDRIE